MLQAIDRLGKDVDYYAVDLSLPELERTFAQIPTGKYLPFSLYDVAAQQFADSILGEVPHIALSGDEPGKPFLIVIMTYLVHFFVQSIVQLPGGLLHLTDTG